MSSSSVDAQIAHLGNLLHETSAISLQIVAAAVLDPNMEAVLPGVDRQVKEIQDAAKNATKTFVLKREEKVRMAIQMCEGFANIWIPLIAQSQVLYKAGRSQ